MHTNYLGWSLGRFRCRKHPQCFGTLRWTCWSCWKLVESVWSAFGLRWRELWSHSVPTWIKLDRFIIRKVCTLSELLTRCEYAKHIVFLLSFVDWMTKINNISVVEIIMNEYYSPFPSAERIEWNRGQKRGTRPQRSNISEWHRYYRGSKCDKWPSSSSLWWTTHVWFSQRPAEPSAGGLLFDSVPIWLNTTNTVWLGHLMLFLHEFKGNQQNWVETKRTTVGLWHTIWRSSMRVLTPAAISFLSWGVSGHGYRDARNLGTSLKCLITIG